MGTWRDELKIGDKVICKTAQEVELPCVQKGRLVYRYYIYSKGEVYDKESHLVYVKIEKNELLKGTFPDAAPFYIPNSLMKATSVLRKSAQNKAEKYDIEKDTCILRYTEKKWKKCQEENVFWRNELEDLTEMTPVDICRLIQDAKGI